MRLIDADDLLDYGMHFQFGYNKDGILLVPLCDMTNSIRNAPTVDAEPVVRCKECVHYRNGICGKIEYIMDGYYHGTFEEKRPDDFCSYGEKKNRGKVHAAD